MGRPKLDKPKQVQSLRLEVPTIKALHTIAEKEQTTYTKVITTALDQYIERNQ